MADLPTNYLDDILSDSMGGKRRFKITNLNGTSEEVTIEDISKYDQVGSTFGAGDINKINQAVNEKFDSGDVVDPMLTTEPGFAADALAVKNQLDEQNKNFLPLSGGTLTGNLTAKRIDSTDQYLTGSLYVGGKESTSDGRTGVAFGKSGNITMQNASSPTINLIAGYAKTAQASISGNASGNISLNGGVTFPKITEENGGMFGYLPSKNLNLDFMRIVDGGDDSPTVLIIGDGLYANAISRGALNLCGYEYVQMICKSERILLSSSTDENYSGFLRPNQDNKCALGMSSKRFKVLYAGTNTINTSDIREKENVIEFNNNIIQPMIAGAEPIDLYSELFDRLKPVEFNFIDESKVVYGFVAQDVVESMEELGLDENDLDLVHHDFWTDEETGEEKDRYGLAYNNLIALLVHEVQKLKAEVKELKNQ